MQCSQRPPLAQPKWVRSIGTPPAVLGFSPRQIEADHSSWRLLSPFRRIKRWRKALGEVLLRAWLWTYHRLTHLRKTRHQHVQHRTHEPSFGVLSSTVTKWSRTCQVDHPHANFSQYIAKAPADCLLSIGQGLGASSDDAAIPAFGVAGICGARTLPCTPTADGNIQRLTGPNCSLMKTVCTECKRLKRSKRTCRLELFHPHPDWNKTPEKQLKWTRNGAGTLLPPRFILPKTNSSQIAQLAPVQLGILQKMVASGVTAKTGFGLNKRPRAATRASRQHSSNRR